MGFNLTNISINNISHSFADAQVRKAIFKNSSNTVVKFGLGSSSNHIEIDTLSAVKTIGFSDGNRNIVSMGDTSVQQGNQGLAPMNFFPSSKDQAYEVYSYSNIANSPSTAVYGNILKSTTNLSTGLSGTIGTGYIEFANTPDSDIGQGFRIGSSFKPPYAPVSSTVHNNFALGIDSSGTKKVSITDPSEWREELAIKNIGTQFDYWYNATAIPNNTVTNVGGAINFSAGTWIINYGGTFTSNATGFRAIFLSTVTTGTQVDRFHYICAPAVSGADTALTSVVVERFSAATTRYINVLQNSGSQINSYIGIYAVKLSDFVQ